ncbi:MAG: DMT family transporter [Rhizobiaceae bacterium]
MSSVFEINDRLKMFLILNAIPLCFSTNIVSGRALREAVEPSTLAFYRWLIASIILLAISGRLLWKYRAKLVRVLDLLFLLGFFGMLVCGAVFYAGLQQTTAVNGSLIYMASPAIIIMLEVALRGLRLNFIQILGIIASMAGVAMILLVGGNYDFSNFEWHRGDLYCIAGSVSWALYSFTLKMDRLSEFPTLVLFSAIAVVGTIILFPFYLWENGPAMTPGFSSQTWLGIGVVSLLASVLAFGLYQKGVALVGPSTTSMYLYLMPVYAVILAYLFLDESISYIHAVGFVLIACGLYFATQIPKSALKLKDA